MLLIVAACADIVEKPLQLSSHKAELKQTDSALLGRNEAGIGLESGSQLRPFTLRSHVGEVVSLHQLLQRGTLLVVFYRGGWCPYCNLQVRQLTEAWPAFKQRQVTPVLISVDQVEAAALAQRSYEIPFPVLSDPQLDAHEAFEVVLDVDENTYQRYREYGIDLEQWSGQTHHKIAVSSAFIVDKTGEVLWAHSALDYKTRPSVEQLLRIIDAIQ